MKIAMTMEMIVVTTGQGRDDTDRHQGHVPVPVQDHVLLTGTEGVDRGRTPDQVLSQDLLIIDITDGSWFLYSQNTFAELSVV
jgi:hypothetical protein